MGDDKEVSQLLCIYPSSPFMSALVLAQRPKSNVSLNPQNVIQVFSQMLVNEPGKRPP